MDVQVEPRRYTLSLGEDETYVIKRALSRYVKSSLSVGDNDIAQTLLDQIEDAVET